LSLASDGAGQAPSSAAASPSLSVCQNFLSARFDSREIKTAAEPGADVVDLCCGFTNTGEIPLIVQQFFPSCTSVPGDLAVLRPCSKEGPRLAQAGEPAARTLETACPASNNPPCGLANKPAS
jgi:hypothetical protein